MLRFWTSRAVIIFALIFAQLGIFFAAIIYASLATTYVMLAFMAFSLIMVIIIVGRPLNPSYKIIWCIMILLFPLFGGVFYLIWGEKSTSHKQSKRLKAIIERSEPLLPQDEEALEQIAQVDYDAASQARYLHSYAEAPLYGNTATRYIGSGNEKLDLILADIESAQRFIFLEYFIIEPGRMWNTVLEALERKIAEGVEVRLIYDDVGSLTRLPHGYIKTLRSKGLKVETFNQLRPQLTLLTNHRDHRKIAVIDGRVAYTGGINFSDEYINEQAPWGTKYQFKDSSVRVEGPAVWSFTVMFLQMWELTHGRRTKEDPEDYEAYRVPAGQFDDLDEGTCGWVIPYADNPLDKEQVGENVYLNLVNEAHHQVLIATPYLVIDDIMTKALRLAAKRGVDVRIITPHVPDKWLTFLVTRAHYRHLLQAGVRVYEYTPGFIHSKLFVVDGHIATVGTVNLDYRSLFLHFECGLWMMGSEAVSQELEDYHALLDVSEELSLDKHYSPKNAIVIGVQAIMRFLAPVI